MCSEWNSAVPSSGEESGELSLLSGPQTQSGLVIIYEGCSETNETAFIKQKQRQLKLWNSVQMYRYIWPIYRQEHF